MTIDVTNIQRPLLPYTYGSLLNSNRYQDITNTNSPVTGILLDTDFNYLIDACRALNLAIQGVSAGNLIGSDNPINAGKLVTNDGAGDISWVFVTDENCAVNSIAGNKLINGSVGTIQLAAGSVTSNQMAPLSVGTSNLIDACVTATEIAAGAILTIAIAAQAVTAAQIADNTITATQIADNTITATQIADNTITATQIAADVIPIAAVKADQIAGTSTTLYTNPAVQQNHPSAAKFWCKFDPSLAGTNAPIVGYNVPTVTKTGTGVYTINFTVPFTTNDYVISPTLYFGFGAPLSVTVNGFSTGNCSLRVCSTTGTSTDPTWIYVVGYGLQ